MDYTNDQPNQDTLTVKFMALYMRELLRMDRGWDLCKVIIGDEEYTIKEFRKYYKKLRILPDKCAILYLKDKNLEYIIGSKDCYIVQVSEWMD